MRCATPRGGGWYFFRLYTDADAFTVADVWDACWARFDRERCHHPMHPVQYEAVIAVGKVYATTIKPRERVRCVPGASEVFLLATASLKRSQ